MRDARNLRRTPALIEAEIADDIRRGHAEVRRIEIDVGAWAAGADSHRALRGDRRREAAAEGRGIGEHQRLVEALLVGRVNVVPTFAAAEERKERRRFTSRDPRPLDVTQVHIGLGTEIAVGACDPSADAVVKAVAGVKLELSVTAQHAIGRVSARIERKIAAHEEADIGAQVARSFGERRAAKPTGRPAVAVLNIAGAEVCGDVAADLQAGVAARDDEAGHAANVTNPDIFSRCGLPGGKIGSLGAGDCHNTGSRSEQNALHERHYKTSND
jgi:hypothetical protein